MNIFYSDMDGTLLDSTGRLSEQSRERLRALLQDGVAFSVATGRNMHTIVSELRDLPITWPVIDNNGSSLTDYKSRNKLQVNYLPQEHIRTIIDRVMASMDAPLFFIFDGEERFYTVGSRMNKGMSDYIEYRRSLGEENFVVIEDPYTLPLEHMINIQVLGSEQSMMAMYHDFLKLGDQYATHAMYTYHEWWYVNVASHDSSKAHGLREVRKQFGPQDRLIVFGDNVNDIPMLLEADVAVAVDNAIDEVKQVADIVIGRNTDDAVIQFIEQNRDTLFRERKQK